MHNNRLGPLFSKSKPFLFCALPQAPQGPLPRRRSLTVSKLAPKQWVGLLLGIAALLLGFAAPLAALPSPVQNALGIALFALFFLDDRTHTHRAEFGGGTRLDPGCWPAELRAEPSSFSLQDNLARPRRHGPELGGSQNGPRRRAGVLASVPSVATPFLPPLPIAPDRAGGGLPNPIRGNPRPVLDAAWHCPRRAPTCSPIVASEGRSPALLALQHVFWWLWLLTRLTAPCPTWSWPANTKKIQGAPILWATWLYWMFPVIGFLRTLVSLGVIWMLFGRHLNGHVSSSRPLPQALRR